jgi:hypothetical protein
MITIKRIAENEYGTFGVLIDGDLPFALTLERRWLDNQTGISCIPVGKYQCRRVDSPHFGDTFEVTSVPGRTNILFHKGNIDDNSRGCIIVGEEYDPVLGSYGVKASGDGYGEFMQRLRGLESFDLEIVSV